MTLWEFNIPTLPQRTREGWGTREQREVNKLQFQVKGQEYFLAFVEDEKRWFLFSPTAEGLLRTPVYIDAPKYGRLAPESAAQKLSS